MTDLFTTRHGVGEPTLMLVHGWACDHRAMRPVADAFPDMAATLVDLLGHGLSRKAQDYAIEAQADATLRVAPDCAVWIGHSMGAQVAIAAAVQAPERVAAIVLLDPAQIAPHEAAVAFGEKFRSQLAQENVSEVIEAFARCQIRSAHSRIVEDLVAMMCATDPSVARPAWDALITWDGRTAIAQIRCPMLLVAIDKPANRLSDVARLNNQVTTAQVAGSGHMLQFEVMDQIAPMVRRFLSMNGLINSGRQQP